MLNNRDVMRAQVANIINSREANGDHVSCLGVYYFFIETGDSPCKNTGCQCISCSRVGRWVTLFDVHDYSYIAYGTPHHICCFSFLICIKMLTKFPLFFLFHSLKQELELGTYFTKRRGY